MLVKISDIKFKRRNNIDLSTIFELSNSIKENGLYHPIIIDKNYNLLSGYKRLISHLMINLSHIECSISYNKNVNVEENLCRSHLDDIEIGELLLERDKQDKTKRKGDNRYTINNKLLDNNDISKMLGVSIRTIQRKKQIAKNIIPELKDKLRGTQYGKQTNDLLHISKLPTKNQKLICNLIDDNQQKKLGYYVNEARKQIRIEEGQKYIDALTLDNNLRNDKIKLYNTDFTKLPIEDNTIDIIFTDPPYLKEYKQVYLQLARQSNKWLKDGGLLFVYCEKYQLLDVINTLSSYLNYQWQIIIKYNSSVEFSKTNYKIFSSYKMLLFFSKGQPKKKKHNPYLKDVIESPKTPCINAKRFHKWGQSIVECDYILEQMTETNDTLVEPFMGSGTTIISGIKKGLSVIGAEIEQKSYQTTQKRVEYFLKNKQDFIDAP